MSEQDQHQPFENHLIELQSQLAFQEDTIQALNDIVARQQRQIDRLQEQSGLFKSQLERTLSALEGSEFIDLPPPHY